MSKTTNPEAADLEQDKQVLALDVPGHRSDRSTDPLRVGAPDAEKERLATTIMKGHSGRDVHVHSWSE